MVVQKLAEVRRGREDGLIGPSIAAPFVGWLGVKEEPKFKDLPTYPVRSAAQIIGFCGVTATFCTQPSDVSCSNGGEGTSPVGVRGQTFNAQLSTFNETAPNLNVESWKLKVER
jgi:hypothetical protein